MTRIELTGKINEPVKITADSPTECVQTNDIKVNLKQALDRKSAMFTPSEEGIYVFDYGPNEYVIKVGEMPPTPKPDDGGEVPPLGTVVDFGTSFNEPARTLTKHGERDKFDPRWESRAGDNRKITIGNGVMIIEGDQVRGYGHFDNEGQPSSCPYNVQLDYDRTFEGKAETDDDGSDELISRHNEGEISTEAYNKIGGEITSEERGGAGNCKRETTHPNYVPIKKYTGPKVANGEKHHVRYQVIHDDAKKEIHIKRWINDKLILDAVDDSAPATFFDKATLTRKSYFRIRNNGAGKTIVENPKITFLQ